MALPSRSGPRGRQPRLGIVDIYKLDRHRQLILLRRDDIEHLLLVGGPNDVIVERSINRDAGAQMHFNKATRAEPPSAPPAFGPSRPMDVLVADAPGLRPTAFSIDQAQAGAMTQNTVVAPDHPADHPRPAIETESKAAKQSRLSEIIAARAAQRTRPPPTSTKANALERQADSRPINAAEPTFAPEGGAISSASQEADVLLAEPPSKKDSPASERSAPEPGATPLHALEPPTAKEQARPTPILPLTQSQEPPIARSTTSHPVDPAVVPDMAGQLEETRHRPSAGASPAAHTGRAGASPEPAAPPPTESQPQQWSELKPAEAPGTQTDRQVDATQAESGRVNPVATAITTGKDEPVAATAEPNQNLFSVDEIEAEFARLLGRPLPMKG